jgi:hypothetical protein
VPARLQSFHRAIFGVRGQSTPPSHGDRYRSKVADGSSRFSLANCRGRLRWPLAWDAQGALYSFWADGKDLRLARSADKGETWTTWRVASGDGVSYYPYLIAKGRGELVASWFSGRGESLKAHVARIDASDAAAPPKVTLAAPFELDCWQAGARPEDRQVRYIGGEYLATTFLKEGGLGVVSFIQNPREQRFGFSWRRFEAR